MSAPPEKWFAQREKEAAESETEWAEELRRETVEIAFAYHAGDPAAKLTVAVDLREPSSFTEEDLQALEAVKADPEANARFEKWSMMIAEAVIDPMGYYLKGRSED